MATFDNVCTVSVADPPETTTPSTSLGVRFRWRNLGVGGLLPVANWETGGGRVVASPTVSFAA
jgi:hypothetical protein